MSTSIFNPNPAPPLAENSPNTREIAARLKIRLAERYHVLRLIGLGGMASVYLVRHRILHSLFAVKVLHPAQAEQPELLARFRREGLLGARLSAHPNIAPVLDVGDGDGLHYLLMPYIRGEDLDHLLARVGPLSLQDAVLTVLQINDAVHFAWNHGVLHCDLTPGNVRLNEFGQFILFDFGLAQTGFSQQHPVLPPTSKPHPGTPLYMSPERFRGEGIDIRSDLYALGAILYELLTGEAAFHGDSIEEIERRHLASGCAFSHPRLQKHAFIQPLLKSLLAPLAADRFSDPVELDRALRMLVNHPPCFSISPEVEFEQKPASSRRRLSAS
ncbi:MAG: serine/threonine-protein kinase [Terracidiphilus sp.]|jgi:serine/threonine-protein kinase